MLSAGAAWLRLTDKRRRSRVAHVSIIVNVKKSSQPVNAKQRPSKFEQQFVVGVISGTSPLALMFNAVSVRWAELSVI